MLQAAIAFITLALVLYTIGVWAERLKKSLHKWHVIIFWLGFVCDTIGTASMGQITDAHFAFNLHTITGAAALTLMLFHAGWATNVILRRNEKAIQSFHKLSIVVWCVWLIPYFTGMFMGMQA